MRRTLMMLVVVVLSAGWLRAETLAIKGGKIFPVSGPPVENATVVIVDGKITAIGAGVAVPAGAKVVEATGSWITPGLFNGATALGVEEIGAVRESADGRAKGDRNVAAAFRVWEGLNPASVLFAPARNEGVTHAAILPNGGLVSGQAAVIETLDGVATDMVRRAPAAVVANLGSPSSADTTARGELLQRFREILDDARAYGLKKLAFEAGNTRAFAVNRLHLEALAPVLAGKLPLIVEADRASDIENAVSLAQEYKIRLTILGGAEAWKIAPRLAAAKVSVITTALDNIPGSFATLGARQENAALLRKAGVGVAISAGTGESFNVRNIRQHAGNAVAYGLPWDEALRAVTFAPAEIFGVDGSVGSLQVGRDANLVVWDGDPFEFATRATLVLVRGHEAQSRSRQDELTDRYKTRYAR